MNTLYAFGCSFTDWTYYKNYCIYDKGLISGTESGFTEEQHWVSKLATELGMKWVNNGDSGTSNESILRKFYKSKHLFKEGDVIILQATFGERVTMHHSPTDEMIHLAGPLDQIGQWWKKEPWADDSRFVKLVNDYIVLYNIPRFTLSTMYQAFPIISEWCEMKGIKILFWGLDDIQNSPYLFKAPNGKGWMNWIDESNLTIYDELGNDDSPRPDHIRPSNDKHLSRVGFDVIVKLFLSELR